MSDKNREFDSRAFDKNREFRDVVAIYGAIDQAVQRNPPLAKSVSELLPVYTNPEGVHWFEDFTRENAKSIAERGGNPEQLLPTLEDALADLGEIKPWCRMAARRIFAIAVAGRAFPEMKQAESPLAGYARKALAVEGLVGTERDEDAAGLLELLIEDGADEELASTSVEALGGIDAWWEHRLERAFTRGWLPPPAHIGPPPCSGRLVWVDIGGDREPAVVLTTVFETDLPFADAAKFCNPKTWECFPFWCSMDDLHEQHNGIHRYREKVSLNCDDPDNSWTLVVDLDFTFTDLKDTAGQSVLRVAEYRLRDGLPQERVLVNQGSLVVAQLPPEAGGRVKVTTTKRLKFAGSFDGPAFASVLCHAGYLGYVEDLLCCAAGNDPDTPFPGLRPGSRAERATPGADKDFRGLTKFTIDQVASTLEKCIDDCAKTAKGSCGKDDEDKTASPFETLVHNMGTSWVRMLDEGAAVADVGLRSVRMAPGNPRGTRSGPRASGACGAGTKGSATAEVIEDYTDLAKWLIRNWSGYAGGVATKLDAGSYDADSAAADVAAAVSLAIESGARLGWEAVDAITILTGFLDRPYTIESDEFSTRLNGAALALVGDFFNGFGDPLPASVILIVPPHLGQNETRFKLRCDATGRPAGTYWGGVVASTPGDQDPVDVRITVP